MIEWFTHPAGQIALFAVIEAGVLGWLYRSRRRVAIGAAVAVPIIGALVVMIDLAHQSPREQVDGILEEVRKAVLDKDPDTVLHHIDPEYDYQGMTFERLRAWLPDRLARLRLTRLRITDRQFTTVTAKRIRLRLAVRVVGRGGLGYGFDMRTTWWVTLLPLEGRWVVAAIEPIEVDGSQFGSLSELP